MKRKRFSVEHITTVLQQAESGVLIGDLGHQVGISEQSFYRWRKVYGNLQPSEARELKPPRMRTRSSSGWSRPCRSTRSCSRMCCQQSSETRQAARGRALRDGPRHSE